MIYEPHNDAEQPRQARNVKRNLLFLHVLLVFGYVSESLLQVVTALQGFLKFSLHVVDLKDARKDNKEQMSWRPASEHKASVVFTHQYLLSCLLLQMNNLILPVNPLRLQLTRQQVRVLQAGRAR